MTAVIVCSGSVIDYSFHQKYFKNPGLVICVDGGAKHIRKLGLIPDVLIGDLDSITKEDFQYLSQLNVKVVKYPREKDMTDTEIAVNFALESGCTEIIIMGGIGTRLDHSLGNILLMRKLLDKGINCVIVNEHNEITLVKDKISILREEGFKLSLLPLTDIVEGIKTKGLYYELDYEDLEIGSTRGISNEFNADEAEISIRSGILMVIKSRD